MQKQTVLHGKPGETKEHIIYAFIYRSKMFLLKNTNEKYQYSKNEILK